MLIIKWYRSFLVIYRSVFPLKRSGINMYHLLQHLETGFGLPLHTHTHAHTHTHYIYIYIYIYVCVCFI
jgi:hypothetical protein